MATNLTATADILPACVIHKILCHLSYREATLMRILSKTWLQAWSTLPSLEFRVGYLEDTEIMDSIMESYRDNKIFIDKFECSNCLKSNSCYQVFPLIHKWLGIALQNGVKDIVYRDPYHLIRSYPFPIFNVLSGNSLRELVLEGCNLKCVRFPSGVANYDSLRKLSLTKVNLDENMLQFLLNSCPLIVSFILEHCSGLRKIELLSLQKIRSVSITTNINQRAKILAPTLEHLSYSGSKNFHVVECQNLKSLVLSNVSVSDGFLHDLISRSQSLKALKIQNCERIREIDSSNLVSLEYMGIQIPELKMDSESSQLKHSKVVLKYHNSLHAAWFCKFGKFLSNSTSWSQVFLYFSRCNGINMKGLQLHPRIANSQVDILHVNIRCPTVICSTFVDALLWSCHPRRLNLSSTVEMNNCFIDCLMYMNNPRHSSAQRSKPWHSQLKEIKAFDGENQPLQLRSGELTISTLTEREEVYFLLDW